MMLEMPLQAYNRGVEKECFRPASGDRAARYSCGGWISPLVKEGRLLAESDVGCAAALAAIASRHRQPRVGKAGAALQT